MPPVANPKQRTTVARALLLGLGFVMLSACGQTGPLYQPEPEEPAAANAEPGTTPSPGTSDP